MNPDTRGPERRKPSELWSHEFPRVVRARGKTYAREGKVYLLSAAAESLGDNSVDAIVEGSVPYSVRIDWSDDGECELIGSCTCPAFERFGPCKHMWAAILAMESEGVGPSLESEDGASKAGAIEGDAGDATAGAAPRERARERPRAIPAATGSAG